MILQKIKKYQNWALLIGSNLFLLLAFYFNSNTEKELPLPKNHRLLLIPLEIFVPYSEGHVTIYDESDHVVVKKAKIHKKDSINQFDSSNLHLVEIEIEDLGKIINFKGRNLRAFPMIDDSIKKGEESYEFTF